MEEQPSQSYPQDYSYQQQPEVSDSFLKAMIEVEETMQKFEYETLRRKRLKIDYKNKKKEWVPISPDVPQMCNELGIAEILGFLRSRVTIIGRLTKKTKEEIMRDMFQFHEALKDMIALRSDSWLLDEELTKPLTEACLSLVEDVTFSSDNGFSAMNIRSSYNRHEQVTTNPDSNENVKTILGLKVGK